MIVDDLKKSILNYAFTGRLSKTLPSDTNVVTIMQKIEEIHNNLIDTKIIKLDKKVFQPDEKEYPYTIPTTWIWSKLYYIIDVRDGTHDSPKYYKDGIPLITSKNLNVDGTLDLDNVKFISESDAKVINNRSNVDNDDILFAMIGSIGNPVIIKEKTKFCIKNVALFKNPVKDYLDNDYLYYYLYFSQSRMKKESSGGVQQFVSLNYLRNFYIPIPPIEEQRRIVTNIKKLFDLLNETTSIETELFELKKLLPTNLKFSILNYAIKGKLIKNDDSLESTIESNYANPPFQIPNNWAWVEIDDVLDIQTGLGFKKMDQCNAKDGIVRVLRGGNINNNYQYELKDDDVYVKNIDKYIELCEGDILTPSVTSMEQIGKVAYIDKNLEKITAGGFVYIIRCKDKRVVNPKYVLYFISSKFHKEMCKPNIHKSGQAFYNLKKSGLIEQPIPIPPIKEQQRIVDKIEQLLPLCNDIEKLVNG